MARRLNLDALSLRPRICVGTARRGGFDLPKFFGMVFRARGFPYCPFCSGIIAPQIMGWFRNCAAGADSRNSACIFEAVVGRMSRAVNVVNQGHRQVLYSRNATLKA